MRTAGWLTLSGGVVSLVGAAVMYRLVAQKPQDNESPSQLSEQTNTIRDEHRAGQVLLYTGVLAVATGASLVLFAPKDSTTPHVAVGLAGVTLAGSF